MNIASPSLLLPNSFVPKFDLTCVESRTPQILFVLLLFQHLTRFVATHVLINTIYNSVLNHTYHRSTSPPGGNHACGSQQQKNVQTCFHLRQCHARRNPPQSMRLRRKEAKLLYLLIKTRFWTIASYSSSKSMIYGGQVPERIGPDDC